jgi:hypothetical protein
VTTAKTGGDDPKKRTGKKGTGKRPVFSTVANPTAPNADELPATPPASRRRDVQTSAPKGGERLSAFTWRLTTEQGLLLDGLQLRLRRDLDVPRINRADMLDALVRIADESPGVYGALLARLQDVLTSERIDEE